MNFNDIQDFARSVEQTVRVINANRQSTLILIATRNFAVQIVEPFEYQSDFDMFIGNPVDYIARTPKSELLASSKKMLDQAESSEVVLGGDVEVPIGQVDAILQLFKVNQVFSVSLRVVPCHTPELGDVPGLYLKGYQDNLRSTVKCRALIAPLVIANPSSGEDGFDNSLSG